MSPEDRQFAANRLEPISQQARRDFRAQHPNLPDDYLDWMSQVGWGELVESFVFYSGPVSLSDIYGADAPSDHALAFGDDMAGYVVGLDLAHGGAVEWGPKGEEVARWPTFSAFVAERVAQLREDSAAAS